MRRKVRSRRVDQRKVVIAMVATRRPCQVPWLLDLAATRKTRSESKHASE